MATEMRPVTATHNLGCGRNHVWLARILAFISLANPGIAADGLTPGYEIVESDSGLQSLAQDSLLYIAGSSNIDSIEIDSSKADAPYFKAVGARKPAENDVLQNRPFGVGERLRYHMEFSFIRAGFSEMSILEIDSTSGYQAYHFRSRVRSTRTIDMIYKVRDDVQAWFDLEGLYSHRYERRIHEGGYRHIKFYDYNHDTGWVSISNEYGPKGLTAFQPFSHNIISALYWIRCQELEAGKDLTVPLHDQNVQYPLKIIVYGIEEVRVPYGTFTCWKVEPVLESEGLFKMSGRLWIWLTNDERRLPVLMKTEIPVGTIEGKLVEYRPGRPEASDSSQPYERDNER